MKALSRLACSSSLLTIRFALATFFLIYCELPYYELWNAFKRNTDKIKNGQRKGKPKIRKKEER
jgi:hypothetical protein